MPKAKVVIPAGCIILPCNCRHAFQDKVYGQGKRVHNAKKCKSGGLEYKCTVCSSIHQPQAKPTHDEKENKDDSPNAASAARKVSRAGANKAR